VERRRRDSPRAEAAGVCISCDAAQRARIRHGAPTGPLPKDNAKLSPAFHSSSAANSPRRLLDMAF
jgi:hypothetical protein